MDRKKAKIQNDISELQNKINDFNGKISALQSIREELLEKQYSLRRQLENIDRTERTQELVNQVFSVRENNAQCVRLSMRTKTTKIMDDFVFHSKKNFLVRCEKLREFAFAQIRKSNFACCAFRKSAAVAFRFADQSFLCYCVVLMLYSFLVGRR